MTSIGRRPEIADAFTQDKLPIFLNAFAAIGVDRLAQVPNIGVAFRV